MATATRVALVTGGARGIGAEICRRLAYDGHAVVVNYATSAVEAGGLVAEIEASGGQALAVAGDVSTPTGAAGLVAEAGAWLGPPAVLVNNAGFSSVRTAGRQSAEEWDRVIDVNLNAAYYCTHAALPAMIESRWGRIVYISSAVGERLPMAGNSAYAAAKAGLNAMARCIAKELTNRGITANSVMPGFVDTEMTRKEGAEGYAFMERNWPKVPAEAIAASVSFLVSDDARYVSGEEIGVWHGGPSFRP